MQKKHDKAVWRTIEAGSGIMAGLAAHSVLRNGWQWATNSKPPRPASPRTPLTKAAMWSAATGLGLGVLRMLAKRSAARGWEEATGRKIPR